MGSPASLIYVCVDCGCMRRRFSWVCKDCKKEGADYVLYQEVKHNVGGIVRTKMVLV
jgi:hypothetical protein